MLQKDGIVKQTWNLWGIMQGSGGGLNRIQFSDNWTLWLKKKYLKSSEHTDSLYVKYCV